MHSGTFPGARQPSVVIRGQVAVQWGPHLGQLLLHTHRSYFYMDITHITNFPIMVMITLVSITPFFGKFERLLMCKKYFHNLQQLARSHHEGSHLHPHRAGGGPDGQCLLVTSFISTCMLLTISPSTCIVTFMLVLGSCTVLSTAYTRMEPFPR